MGMYDDIRCKYPLPIDGANELDFQTKDTDSQYCDQYEIREDGTLWHEVYDTEDQSDPNAEGLMAICGMATRVNKRWEQDFMTGEVRFYTFEQGKVPDWYEFSAYFVKGAIQHLEVIAPVPTRVSECDQARWTNETQTPGVRS